MRGGTILDFNRIDVMTGKTNCAKKIGVTNGVFLKIRRHGMFHRKIYGGGKFKERLLSPSGGLTVISVCVNIELGMATRIKCDGHAQK